MRYLSINSSNCRLQTAKNGLDFTHVILKPGDAGFDRRIIRTAASGGARP